MDLSKSYVSNATEYDVYEGWRSVNDLSQVKQDELIRAVLEPNRDFRALVMSWELIKEQVEGLWTIIVLIGCSLENAGEIRSLDDRSDADITKIIEALEGTVLWLRLEEAFPPFDVLPTRTQFDWDELECISMQDFVDVTGENIVAVKDSLRRRLTAYRDLLEPGRKTRLPYAIFKYLYAKEDATLHVDRGLAGLAGLSGIVKSDASMYIMASIATAIAAPFFLFFVGYISAAASVALGVFLYKSAKTSLYSKIRATAISNKDVYRWLSSREIIWVYLKKSLI